MSSPLDPPHPVNVKTIKQHKNNESIFFIFPFSFFIFSFNHIPFSTHRQQKYVSAYIFYQKKEVDFSTSLFWYIKLSGA